MPTSNYPTSLDTTSTQVTPGSTTDLDASGYEHDQVHGAASTALIALQTKLGISATPAASASTDAILTHTGTGTTAWSNTITGSTIAGTTLSGAVTGADQVMSAVTHKDYAETCAENAASGTAATIDMNDGNVHHVQLTGNCTFTFSNPVATGDSSSFTLILEQDGTGSRTATWPASVKWAAATAPTLTTTADKFDVLAFTTVDGGTRWFGFVAGQDFA
tara:strand:- start:161 stop:817 length:657 start_codon:yes stop_codon:yes gene_type:complete